MVLAGSGCSMGDSPAPSPSSARTCAYFAVSRVRVAGSRTARRAGSALWARSDSLISRAPGVARMRRVYAADVLAVPFGDGEDHVLDRLRQRGGRQPIGGQRVVLDRVVQPGARRSGRRCRPWPVRRPRRRRGVRRTGVPPCPLPGVRGCGRWPRPRPGSGVCVAWACDDSTDGRSSGTGPRGRASSRGPGTECPALAAPCASGRRDSSSSARSSLTSLATASIRCQAAPSKPLAT